jgi:DNA-binding CsgD family transcriptional regulator
MPTKPTRGESLDPPRSILPLRALFDAVTDGVLVTNAAGYRTYSNPALDALVGGDAKRPLATSAPPSFLPLDLHDSYRAALGSATLAGDEHEIIILEWEILGARGQRIPAVVRLYPVMNGGDSPVAVMWHFIPAAEEAEEPPSDRRTRELEAGMRRIAGELERLSLAHSLEDPSRQDDLERLSAREREILGHLLDGHRVGPIAESLHISPNTVRNHLKSVFRKLGVHSQAELIELFNGRNAPKIRR